MKIKCKRCGSYKYIYINNDDNANTSFEGVNKFFIECCFCFNKNIIEIKDEIEFLKYYKLDVFLRRRKLYVFRYKG